MNDYHHKKAVFFLGAGFSKAIIHEYPTLQELSEKITTQYKGEKESVTTHYYNEIPEQYKENIEHLLTFLSSNLPFKTDVQISADEALYKDLRNKIVEYFNSLNYKFHLPNECNILAEYVITNKIVSITLNYDLLLEKIFLEYYNYNMIREVYHSDFFYKCPINSLYDRLPNNFIDFTTNESELLKDGKFPTILKLHGSINWRYSGISQTDPIFCSYKDIAKDFPYLIKDLQPMIVPPVMDKTSIYNHTILKVIWRQAFEELREATEIYICDFSFPETDLSIRFLFQSALEKNKNLQKIYFINTGRDLENKKEHFSKVFAGYENKFKLDFTYCCEDSLNKFITEVIKPQIENK